MTLAGRLLPQKTICNQQISQLLGIFPGYDIYASFQDLATKRAVASLNSAGNLICGPPAALHHRCQIAQLGRPDHLIVCDWTAVPADESELLEIGVLPPVLHDAERGVEIAVPVQFPVRTVLNNQNSGHRWIRPGAVLIEYQPGV